MNNNALENIIYESDFYTKESLESLREHKNDWCIGDKYYIVRKSNKECSDLGEKGKNFKIKNYLLEDTHYPDMYVEIINDYVEAIVETSNGRYPAYSSHDGYQIDTTGYILLSVGYIDELLFSTYEQAIEFVKAIAKV